MKEEFVSYEEALALKELGFDGDCFAIWSGFDEKNFSVTDTIRLFSSGFRINDTQSSTFYINDFNSRRVAAPTFSQAFRFFREKYSLYSHVRESYAFDNTLEFVTQINGSYVNHGIADKPVNRFETYQEAELECLKKLIEIVKE